MDMDVIVTFVLYLFASRTFGTTPELHYDATVNTIISSIRIYSN